jgi:uncharacterized SAM-binding protein YcdF (DUF218 family)
MLLFLSKFLALFFFPLGLALALMVAGLVLIRIGKKTGAFTLVLCACLGLYFFSSDPLSWWLVRSLERQYHPVTSFPKTSAIVLLTGGETARSSPRLYDEVNEAGDRILYAGRLMAQQVAPRLIITGGTINFLRTIKGSQAEAAARILAGCRDIDTSLILLETKARNTYENGLYTKKLLDSLNLPPSIVLVTSAQHMPRSVAIFKKQGVTVYPAPTDYLADAPYQWKPICFLPNAGALENSTNALHELYGSFAYRLLGWL